MQSGLAVPILRCSIYAPAITDRALDADNARRAAASDPRDRWPLRRYSSTEITAAVGVLDLLYDAEAGTLRRPLTFEEQQFIQNERRVCALDFQHYAANYARIIDWRKESVPFVPNVAQAMVLARWGDLETRGLAISMMQLKARQLGVCLAPHTRVLTADLRWVPIDDLAVGTRIVAVDEHPLVGRVHQRNARRMRTAVVEAKRDRQHDTVAIALDTGITIIATRQHPWLCQQRRGIGVEWRQTGELRVGDGIRRITNPWTDDADQADAWLGGLIDGEGCLRVKHRGGVELSVSQVPGAVLDRARQLIDGRYGPAREEVDRRKAGTSSKLGNKAVHKILVTRTASLFRLLGRCRPVRFTGVEWWVDKELPGKKIGNQWARVVSITPAGTRRVVDLQTSTGTFIAEGVVSHNTTLTEMAIAHRVQFHPRTNAVVASADPQKSRKMAAMIEYNWSQMPWWLMPTATVNNQSVTQFGELNTSLLVQAGNQFTGIARGDTPNCAHISEVCEWPDPGALIDNALLRAMHETPNTFLVLESTALGRGNWWHHTWKLSKEDWAKGQSRLCPIFLPWFVGTDIYPTPTWLRARPVPDRWQPQDSTIHHAERARLYVLSNPLLFEHLAHYNRDWQMPREQLWYYEVERNTAIKKNALNQFLQEMPADDQEAFQSSNISAIGSEIILAYRERALASPPAGVYTIVGPDIPRDLIVPRRHWDFDKPPVIVRPTGVIAPQRFTANFQLVPLRFEGYPDTDPALRLFIFEEPEPGETYGVGVDTSEGLGQDNSVIEVYRKGSLQRQGRQVAEFASAYIKANQLWPMAMAMSLLYSPYQPRRERRQQCRVAIECRGNGEMVQLEMKKRGWTNFHPWLRYDSRKLASPQRAFKEGVYTNVWFRAQMMDLVLTMIDEDSVDIASPWLVEEMEALERDESKQSLKAAYGEHDDRFMALGFAMFSLHVLDLPDRQFSRARQPHYMGGDPNEVDGRIAYATFEPPAHARSDGGVRIAQPLERRRSQFGLTRQAVLGRVYNPAMPRGYK